MLSNTVMKNLSFAAWKNSLRPKIGQFEIISRNMVVEKLVTIVTGGGGIFCLDSSPTISNCTIRNNSGMDGGGISCWDSSPSISNCAISENLAWYIGGGIFCTGSNSTITNCIISRNTVDDNYTPIGTDGGGIYCVGLQSRTIITNCTIANNILRGSGNGIGGVVCFEGVITNCIIWDNHPEQQIHSVESVSYSDIQGGWPGQGNIDTDPCFADPCSGDYHLLPASSCIDAGDPCYVPEPNETDLDGNPRIINSRIDMGAYESDYIQARLWLSPQTINRQSRMKKVMAWMQLPEGITKDQIDQDTPVLLYPGPLEPINQYIFEHGKKGDKRVNIFILYDKAELLSVVPDNGLVDVQVIGSLNTGQQFYGSAFLTILDRQQPRQGRLLKNQ